MTAPAAAAAPKQRPVQQAAVKPAPTQPAVKAPPLRLRLRASFDSESDELQLASLTELKKTASRVKQYAGESIQVYGPLDRSALRGRYASEEERSRARAEQVAAELAKSAGLAPAAVSALPYAPVVIGGQAFNGIQIYVEVK